VRVGRTLLLAWGVLHASAFGQTTMGVIRGTVTNAIDGEPIALKATIVCRSENGRQFPQVQTDAAGHYLLPSVPPETYQLRVEASGFQALEVHGLVVPVSGSVDQDFRLRPLSDIFEQSTTHRMVMPGSRYLARFYGPDLDLNRTAFVPLWESGIHVFEPSVSNVIEPEPIQDLPLPGRDVYTMLLTQPAVISDSATARSLGLSANGQRPSSSNFLVDGLELNNSLIAGPSVAIPPEAIQEYRVSVNGYSAEFGRTAGFLASAVTHSSSGDRWHGTIYAYIRNEALNANDFQNNVRGASRPKQREAQPGYQAGGPIARRLQVSSSFEYLANASRQASQEYIVPGPGFLTFVNSLPTTNLARQLLAAYQPPPSSPIPGEPFAADATIGKPVTSKRYLGTGRVDFECGPGFRLMARAIASEFSWPDFIWSPYHAFSSGMSQPVASVGGSAIATLTPHLTLEARSGWNTQTLGWDRSHPEIPTLTVSFGNPGALQSILPGSPAAYSYKYRARSAELDANLMWWRGAHLIKFGGSFFPKTTDDYLPYAASGRYDFPSLPDFAFATRSTFFASVARGLPAGAPDTAPDLNRQYRTRQATVFVEDSIRLTPRTTLSAGFRYEYLGSPVNLTHANAQILQFGAGESIEDRLTSGVVAISDIGNRAVYTTDKRDAGLRLGFARDLGDPASRGFRSVLRAGYGLYFDQPFDNVWLNTRNNSFVFPSGGFPVAPGTNYLAPVSSVIGKYAFDPALADFPALTVFDPQFRNGAVQHYFLGLQAQIRPGAIVEITGLGAQGRHLLSTDLINRQFSVPTSVTSQAGCDFSRYQPCLPDVVYHGAQDRSSYNALTAVLRLNSRSVFLSVAYTLSHAIDNQSDPLIGDFFDLTFAPSVQPAGFARQFDPASDRSNADFDQRQNLAVYSVWSLPVSSRLAGAMRGWKLSGIAAFRSGFPFSVTDEITAPGSGGILLTRRADIIAPGAIWVSPAAQTPGGKLLLNASAFCEPATCPADRSVQGNSGRNAFRGPGFYSADLSLSRSFRVLPARENARFSIRADAFNFLNHTNLNSPLTDLSSPATFGIAMFGRQLRDIGLPSLLPLRETARQIQLQARLEF
jgi:hypothetical protein